MMEKITVKLPEPVAIDGKEITEIEMRQPTGGDVEGIVGVDNLGRAVTELVVRLTTNVPLTEDDVRALSAKNYLKLSEEVMGFLG